MTAIAVVATQSKSISTHHIIYQYIMHQTVVCCDVAYRFLGHYLLWILIRLYVIVAGEPIHLTLLHETRLQTTS